MPQKNKIIYGELSDADLSQKLRDETAFYQKLHFSHAVTPLDNPMKIRNARREIARLKTEIHKRELVKSK